MKELKNEEADKKSLGKKLWRAGGGRVLSSL